MGIIYCITLILVVAMICDCVKYCRKCDNDTERLERENRNLCKELEKTGL